MSFAAKRQKSRTKILAAAFCFLILLLGLFACWCNLIVAVYANGRIYTDTELVPVRDVGVVLGCPVTNRKGVPNPYYRHRIESAAELYHCGRVSFLIVSGYPGQPQRMKYDLRTLGVPCDRIAEDNDGHRTLASVISARDKFGLESLTFVTQTGHARRSIYLARACGLDAVAYAAKDPRQPKHLLREFLAHVKAVLDVHILHRRACEASLKDSNHFK